MTSLRLTTWLLSSLCALTSTSCYHCDPPEPTPEPAPAGIQVSYAQTQCADPWGFVGPNQQLISVATTFLTQKGITLTAPKTSATGLPVLCAACTCPTGTVLAGEVSAKDLPAIQALGFKKM